MLALIQRVKSASVCILENCVGKIDTGLLAFIGIEQADNKTNAERLFDKILQYRVFNDLDGKMNLSLQDINGGLLLVPQFTLAADTQKGNRPSFTPAASPSQGKELFDYLAKYAATRYSLLAFGEFGANMQVSLCNDGPVTFMLKR